LDKELGAWLGSVVYSGSDARGNKQLQKFSTQDFTINDAMDNVELALITLRQVADQQNLTLQKALNKFAPGATVLDSSEWLNLTPDDSDKIKSTLSGVGSTFYTKLFTHAKKPAAKIESFQHSDRRPLRILVRTVEQSFPWQLLHSPLSNSGDDFWGFKFEIAVQDMGHPPPSFVLTQATANEKITALIGEYSGSDYSVQTMAKQQFDHFKASFGDSRYIPVETATAFTQLMQANATNLNFILIYTHGSDGYTFIADGQGNLSRHPLTPRGQRLIFADDANAYVLALAVDNLDDFGRSGPFFSKNPIVLLNACQTGVLSTNRLTLPKAFLHLGARGVVATDAPVEDVFALAFGDDLIDQMAAKKDMAAALRETRRKYWSQGNPLGLVYAYYVNDAVAESVRPSR
jgi:hypothetical protein